MQRFHNLLRTFTALQVLLDILHLTWGASEDYEIVVKTLNSGKSILINIFLFFLEAVIFAMLFRRLPTLLNSTLKMAAMFRR